MVGGDGGWVLLELTIEMCICPSQFQEKGGKPFSFHLKGFPPYFSPVSVGILLEIGIADGAVWCY